MTRQHRPEDQCRWTAGRDGHRRRCCSVYSSFSPGFCLPLNCGSLGRGEEEEEEEEEEEGWPRRWLINWEARRPLTLMMLGDRADEERRLASSFSGWTCRRSCPRVEKGNAPQKNTAAVFSFLFSPRFWSLFCFILTFWPFFLSLHVFRSFLTTFTIIWK